MSKYNIEQLQNFISLNDLNRVDGIIVFDAAVNFYHNNKEGTIQSSVQIIILPNAIAVYIFEFFKEEYKLTEMYSTADYQFTCTPAHVLEIRKDYPGSGSFISMAALKK